MATQNKPFIAIPMGDAAGIGPEIVMKTLAEKGIYDLCKPFVIGNHSILEKAASVSNLGLNLRVINSPSEGAYEHGIVDIIHFDNVHDLQMGEIQGMCGWAAYEYIQYAIKLIQTGECDSMSTPPINKESLKAGDVPYIDHTSMLSALTGVNDPLTMFEVDDLRIFFLTKHLSLKDAIGKMTKERVHEYLLRSDKALERLGINDRTIAVAGLNPHAGEGGLFGKEEIDAITPGIEAAKQDGVNVYGPVPADSVFHQARNGKYSAVLSLYHDQGHIAAKMADFERTVSITNDLPFLRTSVDHGTAFDVAGTGKASSVSMAEAIKSAAKYTPYFNQPEM